LIPARFDLSEEGRIRLGFDKLEEERANRKEQYQSLDTSEDILESSRLANQPSLSDSPVGKNHD